MSRPELNRFLFEPEDVVIAVGQDGLVANVAKYLSGQMVVGVNPLPENRRVLSGRTTRASATWAVSTETVSSMPIGDGELSVACMTACRRLP